MRRTLPWAVVISRDRVGFEKSRVGLQSHHCLLSMCARAVPRRTIGSPCRIRSNVCTGTLSSKRTLSGLDCAVLLLMIPLDADAGVAAVMGIHRAAMAINGVPPVRRTNQLVQSGRLIQCLQMFGLDLRAPKLPMPKQMSMFLVFFLSTFHGVGMGSSVCDIYLQATRDMWGCGCFHNYRVLGILYRLAV